MLITKRRLTAAIHYLPGHDLTYLNNAKVACSSIKKSLWLWADPAGNADRPHDRSERSPFAKSLEEIAVSGDKFTNQTFFTVVRNPFNRILSAYLDKIYISQEKPGRDAAVWFPFARRFSLAGDLELSFGDFLRMVTSEDPSLLDQHFAPQYINVFSDFVTPHFVGHLEEMDKVQSFLLERNIHLAHHAPHATKANSSVAEYYGDAEVDLVWSYYRRDFDMFGYSSDPSVPGPVRPVQQPRIALDVLRLLIGSYTAPRAEGRRRCIEALHKKLPHVDPYYIAMETEALPLAELKELSDKAIRNEIDNWRLVVRIAQELAANEMVVEACAVMNRARAMLYGR